MKTICILKSEMDNSLFIDRTSDSDKCLKDHNSGKIPATKKKMPWILSCKLVFDREQPAYEFEKFLKTKLGTDIANKYFLFDPLLELNRLLKTLPRSCKVYVMGGLALDGHCGHVSRRHDDADLICWRKDVKIVKEALKKMGYKIKENYFVDQPKVAYRFETDEENPAISFNIIDEKPNNSFEISLGKALHQVFPKKFLGPIKVVLEGIKFPAVDYQLLDALNKNAGQWFERTKKENPKLYKMLGYKISNYKNDRRLIDGLLKMKK